MFNVTVSAEHLRNELLTLDALKNTPESDLTVILRNFHLTKYDFVKEQIHVLLSEADEHDYRELADLIVQLFESETPTDEILKQIGWRIRFMFVEACQSLLLGHDHVADAVRYAAEVEDESLRLAAHAGEYA